MLICLPAISAASTVAYRAFPSGCNVEVQSIQAYPLPLVVHPSVSAGAAGVNTISEPEPLHRFRIPRDLLDLLVSRPELSHRKQDSRERLICIAPALER